MTKLDPPVDKAYTEEFGTFVQARPRSKSGIFDLPSKFSLGLATKPFSDSLLSRAYGKRNGVED